MLRTMMMAAGIAAAVMFGGQANAQAIGETINLDQAKKAAAAAEAEAKKNNWAMAVAVVGPTGDLVYFAKIDGTQYGSIPIAQHKARAAALFKSPTKTVQGRGP